MSYNKIRVNHQIKALAVRVIGPEGENYGVLSINEALQRAHDAGQDLIEISPNANPPVAKISDFGKFQYAENKKEKAAKAKAHTIELKTLQVKIGTGKHDLELKAKNKNRPLPPRPVQIHGPEIPGRTPQAHPGPAHRKLQNCRKTDQKPEGTDDHY